MPLPSHRDTRSVESGRAYQSAPPLAGPRQKAPLTPPLEPSSSSTTAPGLAPTLLHPLQMTPENSSGQEYFTVEDCKSSSDYLIDLSAGIPTGRYPADIQAYLENVSRSHWGSQQAIGWDAMDPTTSTKGYVPDLAAIERGLVILRQQMLKGNGKFLPTDHDFGRAALERNPYYPWLEDMTAKDIEKWLDQAQPLLPAESLDEDFIFLSVPGGFAPPAQNPHWLAIIGELYASHHPVVRAQVFPWLTGAELDTLLGYELGCMIGEERFPYPPIRVDPDYLGTAYMDS